MTTILADAKTGYIVTDSVVTDGDRIWSVRKTVRARGMLLAGAGVVSESDAAIAWFRANGLSHPDENPPALGALASVLILDAKGLWVYGEEAPTPQFLGKNAYEAIGTGASCALAAYRGIGKRTPEAMRLAVKLACGLDANSRGPVRTHKL